MSDFVQNLSNLFQSADRIDALAKPVQETVIKLFKSGGPVGTRIADFLHGIWLGHPLHPVMTDIPVGAWTAAVLLDTMEASSGSRGMGKAADAAVALGIAGAVGSAATGIADWMHLRGESRRTGFTHALLNTMALSLFIGSLVARGNRSRGLGRMLALTGYTIAGASAYLGGDLVFRQKIGVNHAPKQIDAPEYTAVLPVEQLPENQLTRAMLDDTPLVLLRRGMQVYALAESCAHLGGPLAEGDLDSTADGRPTVVCPWHGSVFDMTSGDVLHGPSAYPQPCLMARINNGQVEVAHRMPESAG